MEEKESKGRLLSVPIELERIHFDVYKNFKYVSDIKNYGVDEDWRFPVDEYNVVDDCDGGAIACRYLVKKRTKYPSRLVFCQTETGEYHLVCAVGQYILDNRFHKVVTKDALESFGYKFLYISGLNSGDEWKVL